MSKDDNFELFNDSGDKDERPVFSNFLNYPDATLNWLASTIETAVLELHGQGISERELEVFVEREFEEAWKKAESQALEADTKKALEKLQRISNILSETEDEESNQLAEKIQKGVKEVAEEKELDEDFLPDSGGGDGDE